MIRRVRIVVTASELLAPRRRVTRMVIRAIDNRPVSCLAAKRCLAP